MDQHPKLELYFFDACPYCQKVLRTINEHKISVVLLDIRKNQQYSENLFQDTGRRTVPCLYIDGKPMHESADIVAWLKENLDNLKKR